MHFAKAVFRVRGNLKHVGIRGYFHLAASSSFSDLLRGRRTIGGLTCCSLNCFSINFSRLDLRINRRPLCESGRVFKRKLSNQFSLIPRKMMGRLQCATMHASLAVIHSLESIAAATLATSL